MSGLSRTPGKRVGVNSPPRVRIPLPPPRRQRQRAFEARFSWPQRSVVQPEILDLARDGVAADAELLRRLDAAPRVLSSAVRISLPSNCRVRWSQTSGVPASSIARATRSSSASQSGAACAGANAAAGGACSVADGIGTAGSGPGMAACASDAEAAWASTAAGTRRAHRRPSARAAGPWLRSPAPGPSP